MFFAVVFDPIHAQQPTLEPLGPGEGKPIVIEGAGDFLTSNPLLVSDGGSAGLVSMLYPSFIGSSPDTGLPEPGIAGSMATGWSFSEDGKTLTIALRTDRTWSDGTPITSADIQYAYDAAASGLLDSPLNVAIGPIESLTTPDPHTVVITFDTADCAAISIAARVPVVPAHHFREIFPTFADITTSSPYNLDPQVTAGPFRFGTFRPGELTSVVADPNYPDSPAGHVVPEALVLKVVADPLVAYQQFLAGEITTMAPPVDVQADARARADAGEFRLHDVVSQVYTVLFFNMADPEEPMSAFDADGNLVDQRPHPILSSLNVRRAIAHAIDHAALNMGAFEGTGRPVGGPMLPQSWAYNADLLPYAFDPELSMRLLDEAGWIDHDGDPETARIADDTVETAPAGTVLELTFSFQAGHPGDAVAVLLQDQLSRIGIGLQIDAVDFSVLIDMLDGQQFDVVMVPYGIPQSQPEFLSEYFGAASDIVGSGINSMSYVNPELDETLEAARTVPGCDLAARKALYDRAQQLIYDDVPVYHLNTTTYPVIVQNNVENFDPKPFDPYWNFMAWSIR